MQDTITGTVSLLDVREDGRGFTWAIARLEGCAADVLFLSGAWGSCRDLVAVGADVAVSGQMCSRDGASVLIASSAAPAAPAGG